MAGVTFGIWIELWPSTVLILGFEKVFDAFQGCLFIFFLPSYVVDFRQVDDFCCRRAVIDSPVFEMLFAFGDSFMLFGCYFTRKIDVFRPCSRIELIEHQVIGDTFGFIGIKSKETIVDA